MLLERASAFGRRLSSGRFAVTRILPGPDDDGGRPTLELRTVLLDRASYGAIAASGLSLLIDTGAVWSATAFAEGRSMSLAVGPRSAIETREIHRRLADAWLSTRTSPQQMVRADEADGARILELAALLDPVDLDELRWGVGVLSTAVPVDLFTLAPTGSGSGRRLVRDLPKMGPWVHANVANLPERGPWPPLRGVASRQSTGPVGLAERTPEEWTYDGPQPIARRRGPDRRVVLAGAAILVLGLGAIIAMLLFKGSASPSRTQEFARLPASPETDRGRAGDGKAPDSDGTAAADESQGREEKTPVPGKGMGFPTNPPSGGTAGGSGSSSTGQGASAGGVERSASLPPPQPESDDSSQKTEHQAPTGATPPGRPPGESTASKPAETDSTSGVTPAGGGTSPPPGDVPGSNGGSAFQTGSSDAGEQVGDEDWCDCKRWLQDPELQFPRPKDLGRPRVSSQELQSLDSAIREFEDGVAAMRRIKEGPISEALQDEARRDFKDAIHQFKTGNDTANEVANNSVTATWVIQGVVEAVRRSNITTIHDGNSTPPGRIAEFRTITTTIVEPALQSSRKQLDTLIELDAWLSALGIYNAPEPFFGEQETQDERDWRTRMIAYLCRLSHFAKQWPKQPIRLQDDLGVDREQWSDFVSSRLPDKQRRQGTKGLFDKIDVVIELSSKSTKPILGQMQDVVLEWSSKQSRDASDQTKDCVRVLVRQCFSKAVEHP